MGTPRAITRPSDNAVVWKWENSDLFGANLPNENPSGLGAFQFNLRFPGQYYDVETGTHYNYMRDYDPVTGRYVQSDPIGIATGPSTYGYAIANPLGSKDPLGLFPITGNWCGPTWTGGRVQTYQPMPFGYYLPPAGYVDAACERHDICYFNCREAFKCDKDARGKCKTDCDRDLAAAVRFGYNSGTSFGKAFAIYVWMRFNTFPDPGENDPNCPKCQNKSKWG